MMDTLRIEVSKVVACVRSVSLVPTACGIHTLGVVGANTPLFDPWANVMVPISPVVLLTNLNTELVVVGAVAAYASAPSKF
jgi:hypothetical protein